MPVRVDIVGYVRAIFDRPFFDIELRPGMTVRDLFTELSRHAGPDFGIKIFDVSRGMINEHIAVFVNSKEIRSLEGPDTRLKEGDVVTILPPMAGG
jgi:sulfur-carrier protein